MADLAGEVERAILIANDYRADRALQIEAQNYVKQLQTEVQAWQVCASLFTHTPRKDEVVRHVSMQTVNYAVSSQQLDGASLYQLKDSLLEYTRRTYKDEAGAQADSPAIQNKLAQTLVSLFVSLYKTGWETFIGDFLDITVLPNTQQRNNLAGVVFYLRILNLVHDEIADVLIVRQGQDAVRNNELKDLLRERDMRNITESWKEILLFWADKNDGVLELALRVVGKWVQWIDISLVVNQDMLSLLWPLVLRNLSSGTEDKVRDMAVDTMGEIVGKKMKAADKMQLISFLNLREIVTQLVNCPVLNDSARGTPQYDTDLGEVVAKLVNTTMTDIIKVLEADQVDAETKATADGHLQFFLNPLLRFFSDEYDEICSTVVPSLTDLLTFLRRIGTLPPAYSQMLAPILHAIILKTKFDETHDWGHEDAQTDEAEFAELRKKLQNLQKSVAAVDQNLYIEIVSTVVGNTFTRLDQEGSGMDWRDLELALHEMNLFGELALPNSGLAAKSQPNTVAADRLAVMMSKMVDSGIARHPHPAVPLQYMENCVRYCAFFDTHHHYIPQVLENFVNLMHHDHVRIRTRSWYLFLRLVKHLRAQVGNVAQTVIQSIGDLLPIKAELGGEEAEDDMSSDAVDNSADAVFTSQLYLFEAVGCVSSSSTIPADQQAANARYVMEPLFNDMQQYLPRATNGDAQAILQIHHIVMALGTLANGFSDWQPGSSSANAKPPPAKELSEQFATAAEAILVALKQLNANSEIRSACRSAFSRLLSVLGSAVLPQLPQWIEGLLSQSSSKDEMAMFLRLLEQVVFGFKTEIYSFLDALLGPLLQRVFAGLTEPINGTDDEIQLQELRREFLTFIQVILTNDLGGVLVSSTNQHMFEDLINSIITLGKTIGHGNLVASKVAFGVMAKMALVWGGPDVATISANPTAPMGPPTPVLPTFDQFMITHFHTACWEVLQDPNFRLSDAQSRQVLQEIAGLEQTLYTKTGDLFIQHLRTVTIPNLGIDGDEFLRHLTTGVERKTFVTYLQNLLRRK